MNARMYVCMYAYVCIYTMYAYYMHVWIYKCLNECMCCSRCCLPTFFAGCGDEEENDCVCKRRCIQGWVEFYYRVLLYCTCFIWYSFWNGFRWECLSALPWMSRLGRSIRLPNRVCICPTPWRRPLRSSRQMYVLCMYVCREYFVSTCTCVLRCVGGLSRHRAALRARRGQREDRVRHARSLVAPGNSM